MKSPICSVSGVDESEDGSVSSGVDFSQCYWG